MILIDTDHATYLKYPESERGADSSTDSSACRRPNLIRKTKTHDAGGDADAHVLIDADLAILGASESAYRVYGEKIRQEYAWVSESDYRRGRRRVLQSFLSRPRIFHLLCRLEDPARRNIAAEMTR